MKRYHYDSHVQLHTHLTDFVDAYNFARRLKTSTVSRPMNTSARSGFQSQMDSSQIRPPNAGTKHLAIEEINPRRRSCRYRAKLALRRRAFQMIRRGRTI